MENRQVVLSLGHQGIPEIPERGWGGWGGGVRGGGGGVGAEVKPGPLPLPFRTKGKGGGGAVGGGPTSGARGEAMEPAAPGTWNMLVCGTLTGGGGDGEGWGGRAGGSVANGPEMCTPWEPRRWTSR